MGDAEGAGAGSGFDDYLVASLHLIEEREVRVAMGGEDGDAFLARLNGRGHAASGRRRGFRRLRR